MSNNVVKAEEIPVKVHISEITFNDGTQIPLNKNDLVIFVGPNNVGKSQALNDIYSLCNLSTNTVVVKDIKIHKSKGSLLPLIKKASFIEEIGDQIYWYLNGAKYGFRKFDEDNIFFESNDYRSYRDLFLCHITTEKRLDICTPANLINRNQPWINPIHYASFGSDFNKWLSDNFSKAFGEAVIPNILHGKSIPLCIGEQVNLKESFKNEQERLMKYASILEKYKQAHLQGDGIKSFLGILLYLMLDYYQTYLIDEPEAFLHPPHARIIGQIIGETLNDNQQAFISTHSENFIKGLLDKCPERLKIIRITRKGKNNNISILDNSGIQAAFSNPLIKYSNIMSGIFHKNVVLCESDSDCKFYSFIENKIKQNNNMYSETLYIHCGGKHRVGLIAKTLISLGINVKLILDLDFLDDINIVKSVTSVCGIDWDNLESDFNVVDKQVKSNSNNISRDSLQKEINSILSKKENNAPVSNSELEKIKKLFVKPSRWQQIKECGVSAFPAGDAKKAFNRINDKLRSGHIYLVPVGELERFVPEIGGHGPEWVNKVIENHPEILDSVYKNAIDFIKGMDL